MRRSAACGVSGAGSAARCPSRQLYGGFSPPSFPCSRDCVLGVWDLKKPLARRSMPHRVEQRVLIRSHSLSLSPFTVWIRDGAVTTLPKQGTEKSLDERRDGKAFKGKVRHTVQKVALVWRAASGRITNRIEIVDLQRGGERKRWRHRRSREGGKVSIGKPSGYILNFSTRRNLGVRLRHFVGIRDGRHPVSGFLKHRVRNWPNQCCSFYVPVIMYRNTTVLRSPPFSGEHSITVSASMSMLTVFIIVQRFS